MVLLQLRRLMRSILPALGIALWLSSPAKAVILAGGNNGNTSAPADDPGFANIGISSTGGASTIYLGNGWALTASHVTLDNSLGHLAFNGQAFKYTQAVHSPFGTADLT